MSPIPPSPPARAAWVEIFRLRRPRSHRSVSPPARAAWVEILMSFAAARTWPVAARAGGVG